MFINQKMLTCAGSGSNEDAVAVGATYLFVLDGATGLSGGDVMGTGSDARWLVQHTAAALQRLLPLGELSVAAVLEDTMAQLRQAWRGSADAYPSAAIAVWRQNGELLDYFGLGDCSASVQLWDGTIRCWQETALTMLDQCALDRMQTLHAETGCTMQQARGQITALLQAHRALRNTAAGYWCLDPSGKGIPHARTASMPLKHCRSIFACSDGYEQLIAFGCAADLPQLHQKTQTEGPEALAKQLFLCQQEDAALLRVPRFKMRDDTSAVAAQIGEDQ